MFDLLRPWLENAIWILNAVLIPAACYFLRNLRRDMRLGLVTESEFQAHVAKVARDMRAHAARLVEADNAVKLIRVEIEHLPKSIEITELNKLIATVVEQSRITLDRVGRIEDFLLRKE